MHRFEHLSRAIPVDRIDEEVDRQCPRIDATDIVPDEKRRDSVCFQGRASELRFRSMGELCDSLHGKTILSVD
jgi:hypothetical protein